MKKIPHAMGNQILPLKCGLDIGFSIGQKYQRPFWISVLDLNQSSIVSVVHYIYLDHQSHLVRPVLSTPIEAAKEMMHLL